MVEFKAVTTLLQLCLFFCFIVINNVGQTTGVNKVHGGWTSWSNWSRCSKLCYHSKERSCTNPVPKNGGNKCSGGFTKIYYYCTDGDCIVDGGWSNWTVWSRCSAINSSAVCQHNKTRNCTNPEPKNGGSPCHGFAEKFEHCDCIPVHGGFSKWSQWSTCSPKCQYTRIRTCSDPVPRYGGNQCGEQFSETQKCTGRLCIVHGGWSNWLWSTCSPICQQTKYRTCTKPVPQNGGKQCDGLASKILKCKGGQCVVHGGWSNWLWSTCSPACRQTNYRTCTNPEPQNGGKQCDGLASNFLRECKDGHCIIPGGWSKWSDWTSISSTECKYTRNRACNNPVPQNGGKQCKEPTSEEKKCVHGGWSNWWTSRKCSKPCGSGTRIRSRSCTSPRPHNGGNECPGDSKDSVTCNTFPCMKSGIWTNWSYWREFKTTKTTCWCKRTRICTRSYYCAGRFEEKSPCPTRYTCQRMITWKLRRRSWGK